MFKKNIAITSMIFAMHFALEGAVQAQGDYVVLMHGMHRTRISMKRLEWQLKAAGYEVINQTYPSRRKSVEYIANNHLKRLIEKHVTDPERRVHFVTHSLGGIVVRQFFADNALPNAGRVVMLAPPNQGSELVDLFRKIPFYKYVMGPSAMQLGTSSEDLPNQLGPVNVEVGVIAGNRSLNPLYSGIIDGPDDGKVSVEHTQVEGMKAFITTRTSHTWLMNRRSVIAQIKHFIETGEFTPGNS